MQVLFDGDVVVYRAGFAAEKTHYYVGTSDGDVHDFTTKADAAAYIARNGDLKAQIVTSEKVVEPVENAIYSAKNIILSSLERLQASEEDLVVVLSGPTNFRNGVATVKPYKGNRDPDHRPTHGPDILEYLKRRFRVVVSEDEEADDVLGYMHYGQYELDPYGSVICTIDKDLDMIPGLHYNFRKEESYTIDEDTADRYFWKQMLTGDTVDNIPGVVGYGPKTAAKALQDTPTPLLSQKVRDLYIQAYGDTAEAMMLEMGRLLWIRRHPGEWWNPPLEEV